MEDRLRIDGTEAGERLVGTFGDDHIEGLGGNDLIVERAGDNLLNGGTGDDRILGGVNTDTMDGGTGNDLVNGGLGNDIAIFVVGESNGGDLYSGGDDTDTLRVQVTALQLTDSTILQALKDLQNFVLETAAAGGDTREIHRSDVRPAKAGVFSRRQTCRGKSQKPRSLDSRVAGNQYPEAYRQDFPWESASHWAITKVNA